MFSIWFIYVLLFCQVNCVEYHCDTETDCSSSIFTSADNAWARGYKSLYQSQQTITDHRLCYAALSCKQTINIDTNDISCHGYDSCSNVDSISSTNIIHGWAHSALVYSNMTISNAAGLACYGDQTCSHSTISQFVGNSTLSATGALSLFNATMNVLNGVVNANFRGYYSGYQAIINCYDGTECNIYCYHNGCGGLLLNCYGTAICNVNNKTYFALLPNKTPTNDILFLNSSEITRLSEEQCSLQTDDKTFDVFQEHYQGADIMYVSDVGPICCRAVESCSTTKISYDDPAASIICSAIFSCQYSIISSTNDINIECSGAHSCDTAVIKISSLAAGVGTIHCYGIYGCRLAKINKISTILCTGHASCYLSNITSNGSDISVYLNGRGAGYQATIICNEGDMCNIFCNTYNSCRQLQLYCYGQCVVDCSQDIHCPNITSSNPTLSPTELTGDPTFYPTTHPTIDPTTDPTNMPTVIPTIYPSFFPSFHPTAYPTINPTKETRHPTIDPTTNPITNPTIYPTATPTADGMVGSGTLTTENDDSMQSVKGNDDFTLILIVAVAVAICFFICIGIVMFKKKLKKQSKNVGIINTTNVTSETEDINMSDNVVQTVPNQVNEGMMGGKHHTNITHDNDSESSGDTETDQLYENKTTLGNDVDVQYENRKITEGVENDIDANIPGNDESLSGNDLEMYQPANKPTKT
eukprot:467249_1